MEWQIPPVSRRSFLTGEDFEKDDRLASALVKTRQGELVRVDCLASEEDAVQMPGLALCRWTLSFKPKVDEGREEEAALQLTADNLFVSLFEGEDGDVLSDENAELKHFLGLMLERSRLLRVKRRSRGSIRYVHRTSKREFLVPAVELEPQFFRDHEEKLSLLIPPSEETTEERESGSEGGG